MDHRIPLKCHTVLAFEGISCQIEEVVGLGSNAIVYRGWYWDGLNRELRHHVLIKELFPFHPRQKIWRDENDRIVVAPEARALWDTHRESFEIGNQVHLRLLEDHPDLMVMGANLNSFRYNGTLYTLLGYTGGRSLQSELNKTGASLRFTAQRMIRLLDALEAFHKSGYLHLDISPDNIMLVGQEEQEKTFLIDYNSARKLGSQDSSYLSRKEGYSAPEVQTGNLAAISFASDLYSVAAVFYRCLMGRSLTLEETLCAGVPDGRDSPMLQDVPQTVSSLVRSILKKGLHTLAARRYQSIGQMRLAFRELIDRIDCVGVTHWSLWENGKRSVEELIRVNPSLRYLRQESKLYPIRLEQEESISLQGYLDGVLSENGHSGMLLAQGGMGKTTALLHTAMLQGKRYSPTAPAIFYISLNGWSGTNTRYIQNQILMRLRFKREENTYESAMHALEQLLRQPLKGKTGELPAVLLLLDGLNEIREDMGALIQEINELKAMAGVRIIAASRGEIPELKLETARLMPLNIEDIEGALGQNGLLIPRQQEVLELLRTPLILSIYIQASGGSKQLEIRNEEELMKAYLAALLEKELERLPENSPKRWQTDAALNFVLPAIAAEVKRRGHALTEAQLLKVVEQCWRALNSRALRKAFPQWIGHSADIRGEAETAEQWYGLVIHSLLWQRLGMLLKDSTQGYRVFHQAVEEYLADRAIPMADRRKQLLVAAALLLCALALLGYRLNQQNQLRLEQTRKDMKDAIELSATGYYKYTAFYEPLRDLTDAVLEGDAQAFQTSYNKALRLLESEQAYTGSEKTEMRKLESSSTYHGQAVPWNRDGDIFEQDLLTQLFDYPNQRAAQYVQILPVLKTWMESAFLQGKVPEFGKALSAMLTADANVASELYRRAVGIHLDGADPAWRDRIEALIEMPPQENQENPGLKSLEGTYHEESRSFEEAFSKLKLYIRSNSQQMLTSDQDIKTQLEAVSRNLESGSQFAAAASIDSIVTKLEDRQTLVESITAYIENSVY